MIETESIPKKQSASATFPSKAFAARSATSGLGPFTVQRRTPRAEDVQIEILYCGVCHSDLHQVRDQWNTVFKEGDMVAVGCMVDSCRKCPSCLAGEEQYCENGMILTYNSEDKILGGVTYGGYSESIVVDEAYVLRVPNGLDPAGTAPLLCAGITTYSPLRHWKVGKGQKVGIVGLGGLGHMGLKFAKAFGANVALFTTSPKKTADAVRLGADEVIVSTDHAAMQKHASSFDFILDAVAAEHDLNVYLQMLKRDGTMTLVGAPEKPSPVSSFNLIMGRRRLAGSAIGGIRETQEMLDFCGEKGITADIERIGIQQINEAYGRLLKSDVKYRFVIDMGSLR
jgi:uncharacterized zinc-type alcohol dehydrogenase-like protein